MEGLGLARLKRALTMLSHDEVLADIPFAVWGKEHGAVVVPKLTDEEAKTLMAVMGQLLDRRK